MQEHTTRKSPNGKLRPQRRRQKQYVHQEADEVIANSFSRDYFLGLIDGQELVNLTDVFHHLIAEVNDPRPNSASSQIDRIAAFSEHKRDNETRPIVQEEWEQIAEGFRMIQTTLAQMEGAMLNHKMDSHPDLFRNNITFSEVKREVMPLIERNAEDIDLASPDMRADIDKLFERCKKIQACAHIMHDRDATVPPPTLERKAPQLPSL